VTTDEARTVVLDALARVAPEIDRETIDADASLTEELDLDSMDFLNLVESVATVAGRDIPERDYAQIATLASFAEYLARPAP
jgi:acyl carrier protein